MRGEEIGYGLGVSKSLLSDTECCDYEIIELLSMIAKIDGNMVASLLISGLVDLETPTSASKIPPCLDTVP